MFESLFRRFGYVRTGGAEAAAAHLDDLPDSGGPESWKSADGRALPLSPPEDIIAPPAEPQAHPVIVDAIAKATGSLVPASEDDAQPAEGDDDEWAWQVAMARARARETEQVDDRQDDQWEWQLALARARAKAEDETPMPKPPRRRPRGSAPPISRYAQSHDALKDQTEPEVSYKLRTNESPVRSLLERQLNRSRLPLGRVPRIARMTPSRRDRARSRRSHAPTVAAPQYDDAKQPKQAIRPHEEAPLPRFTTSRAARR